MQMEAVNGEIKPNSFKTRAESGAPILRHPLCGELSRLEPANAGEISLDRWRPDVREVWKPVPLPSRGFGPVDGGRNSAIHVGRCVNSRMAAIEGRERELLVLLRNILLECMESIGPMSGLILPEQRELSYALDCVDAVLSE